MKITIISKNIKLKFLVTITTLIVTIGCKKEQPKYDGYTITGTIKGADISWINLVQPNNIDFTKNKVIDSAQVVDGTFQFKGKVANVDMIYLSAKNSRHNLGPSLYLENSDISVELNNMVENGRENLTLTKILGSKHQNLYQKQLDIADSIWNQKKYALMREIKAEQLRVAPLGKDHPDSKAVYQRFMDNQDLARALIQERNDAKLQFVKNNPESPIAPGILLFVYSPGGMTKEEMKEYYELLQGPAKNTVAYASIVDRYKVYFESLAPGALAADFTLPTEGGGDLTLSEVKGKYIFVDFWASWCVPCRASFPHLKELYKKYKKDGFEVVAIGTGDTEAKWKKAIKEDETVWYHVFDSNFSGKDKTDGLGKVANDYGVIALPTTYILDENLIIVARTRGKEELDAKLKELFGH
ncbi:TlpA disulfide reductase family protein [Cellulophaga lytica]|uniref:TlpA disulfide reductase family protein n=1 Tax=Cellulophaga lytica TaxID=979 RepID=UPI0026E372EE|nr:TlpA disulfide reductase family protein [Cellulophaga lytica]MDO6854746.1 TlpA disulfide reductase family protein [Cellulophaga lytica]